MSRCPSLARIVSVSVLAHQARVPGYVRVSPREEQPRGRAVHAEQGAMALA